MVEGRTEPVHAPSGPHRSAGAAHDPVLDALLETVDKYVVVDQEGAILFASPAAASHLHQLTGETPLPGHRAAGLTFVRPDGSPMPQEQTAAYQAIARQQVVRDFLVGLRPHPDVTYWTRTTAAPLHDPDGAITRAVVVYTDVTQAIETEQLRKATEAHFRAVYEGSPIPAYLWRSDGTVLRLESCNQAAVRNTQGQVLPFLGQSASEAMKDQPQVLEALQRCLASRSDFEEEIRYRFRTGGDDRLYDSWFTFVPPDLVLVYTHDITERRQAQETERQFREELTRARDLLLALSEAAQNVQRARTPEAVYRAIAEEMERMGWFIVVLAVSPDRKSMTVAHISIRSSLLQVVERLAGITTRKAAIPLAPDGFFSVPLERGETVFCRQTVDLLGRGFPRLGRSLLEQAVGMLGMQHMIFAPMADGHTTQLLGIAGTDLSEEDIPAVTAFAGQAAIALRNARLFQAQRKLAQQLVTIQEEERHRLADALHDEAGQSLTALRLRLELMAEELPSELGSLRERLSQAAHRIRSIMDQLRQVAFHLRPPMLDAVGLKPALEGLCDESHVNCTHEMADLPPLPDVVNVTLYRFLQEALTNIAKHAEATRVTVRLKTEGDSVVLTVGDNGVGLQPDIEHVAQGGHGGRGIASMRERLEGLGGHLELESAPGQGTRITAVIPVPPSATP